LVEEKGALLRPKGRALSKLFPHTPKDMPKSFQSSGWTGMIWNADWISALVITTRAMGEDQGNSVGNPYNYIEGCIPQ